MILTHNTKSYDKTQYIEFIGFFFKTKDSLMSLFYPTEMPYPIPQKLFDDKSK